jgi:hypothetical protein
VGAALRIFFAFLFVVRSIAYFRLFQVLLLFEEYPSSLKLFFTVGAAFYLYPARVFYYKINLYEAIIHGSCRGFIPTFCHPGHNSGPEVGGEFFGGGFLDHGRG